jgi:hypothetical protein
MWKCESKEKHSISLESERVRRRSNKRFMPHVRKARRDSIGLYHIRLYAEYGVKATGSARNDRSNTDIINSASETGYSLK